jgi:hypothetical protein
MLKLEKAPRISKVNKVGYLECIRTDILAVVVHPDGQSCDGQKSDENGEEKELGQQADLRSKLSSLTRVVVVDGVGVVGFRIIDLNILIFFSRTNF